MSAIKRSMAVRPAPVVVDEHGHARFPTQEERYPERGKYQDWPGDWGYRVTRVTNDIGVRPGFALSKTQVQALINDGWTVSVLTAR